mmetsp:Transcript_26793/g.36833  ORF Transcript_26793/g.36833 Transcript_26793/m.36833 type:complete len:111 (+) Transcript_26793:1581-1913(+)
MTCRPTRRSLAGAANQETETATATLRAPLIAATATATATTTTTTPFQWFEQHGVGFTDGALFGNKGSSQFVRLNLGCHRATLEEGLKRTAAAMVAWRAREEEEEEGKSSD